jgi:hypothetical protein
MFQHLRIAVASSLEVPVVDVAKGPNNQVDSRDKLGLFQELLDIPGVLAKAEAVIVKPIDEPGSTIVSGADAFDLNFPRLYLDNEEMVTEVTRWT